MAAPPTMSTAAVTPAISRQGRVGRRSGSRPPLITSETGSSGTRPTYSWLDGDQPAYGAAHSPEGGHNGLQPAGDRYLNLPAILAAAKAERLADIDFNEQDRPTGEDHALHVTGQICAKCGRMIEPEQAARRYGEAGWVHDLCPADD